MYIYIYMLCINLNVDCNPELGSQTFAAGAVKELKARRSVQRWKAPLF